MTEETPVRRIVDEGKAAERTWMAWQRTVIATLCMLTVVLRLSVGGSAPPLVLAAACLAVVMASLGAVKWGQVGRADGVDFAMRNAFLASLVCFVGMTLISAG